MAAGRGRGAILHSEKAVMNPLYVISTIQKYGNDSRGAKDNDNPLLLTTTGSKGTEGHGALNDIESKLQ